MPPGGLPERMALDVRAAHRDLATRLRAAAKPKEGFDLQAYLGSPVPALGVPTAASVAIRKDFVKAHPRLRSTEVRALLESLWSGPTWEERAMAIGLLSAYAATFEDRGWSLADAWVDAATGWALSDSLASGPVARIVATEPARYREVLRWTRAENFWRRRASTYALSELIRSGDLDRGFALLERLLYDEEFWVQRAVGTWLRESWKKDAPGTEAFLRRHADGLPPITVTVATERAPKAFREELRRLSKAGAKGASRVSRGHPPARRRPRRA